MQACRSQPASCGDDGVGTFCRLCLQDIGVHDILSVEDVIVEVGIVEESFIVCGGCVQRGRSLGAARGIRVFKDVCRDVDTHRSFLRKAAVLRAIASTKPQGRGVVARSPRVEERETYDTFLETYERIFGKLARRLAYTSEVCVLLRDEWRQGVNPFLNGFAHVVPVLCNGVASVGIMKPNTQLRGRHSLHGAILAASNGATVPEQKQDLAQMAVDELQDVKLIGQLVKEYIERQRLVQSMGGSFDAFNLRSNHSGHAASSDIDSASSIVSPSRRSSTTSGMSTMRAIGATPERHGAPPTAVVKLIKLESSASPAGASPLASPLQARHQKAQGRVPLLQESEAGEGAELRVATSSKRRSRVEKERDDIHKQVLRVAQHLQTSSWQKTNGKMTIVQNQLDRCKRFPDACKETQREDLIDEIEPLRLCMEAAKSFVNKVKLVAYVDLPLDLCIEIREIERCMLQIGEKTWKFHLGLEKLYVPNTVNTYRTGSLHVHVDSQIYARNVLVRTV